MPVSGHQRDIACIALGATHEFGVAIGGGVALNLAGITDRPTDDVDLFIRLGRHIPAAAAAAEKALTAAGYRCKVIDRLGDDLEMFGGEVYKMLAIVVISSDGSEVEIELANFSYREAVAGELGPMVSLPDLAGFKAAAFAGRRAVRDPVDIAELLGRFSAGELMSLAAERDPGLVAEDFADAGYWVSRRPDSAFARCLADAGRDIEWFRKRMADWPAAPPTR